MKHVRCHQGSCTWRGPLTKIRTHMAKKHPGSLSGHHRGSRKESTTKFVAGHESEIVSAIQAVPSHFCPICGRRCG